MAENDVESDISDADVGKMAKSIAVSLSDAVIISTMWRA